MTTLTLTRTSTPRYGSRNWARSQTAPFTAERTSWYDGHVTGWEIKIGGKLIAVVLDDLLIGDRPNQDKQDYMINYGSTGIGNALFGDLCRALEAIAGEDIDDSEPILFSTRS